MKFLTEEQLNKLDTKRLLNIKRIINPSLGYLIYEVRNCGNGASNGNEIQETALVEYEAYYELLKSILATREHIE